MTRKHPLLEGYPLVTTIPVLWGDHDSFNHVNNVVYLRWAETARVEYLLRIGQMPDLPPSGMAPIVASLKCDYRRVVSYPDTVHVGTRVTRIGNSSFRMEHRIVSATLDEVAAEVDSTMVLLDYGSGTPVRVPDETRKLISELEGAPLEALSK